MIIDGFTFYNEYDMLECRLEYLYSHIDYFVLSECNYTHSGNKKPLMFLKEQVRYKKYADKILYAPFIVNLDDYRDEEGKVDCWKLEQAQRENILTPLEKFDENDILLISDLDEIPEASVIKKIQQELNFCESVRVNHKMYMYNLHHYMDEVKFWNHQVAAKIKTAREKTLNWLRLSSPHDGYWQSGWHLSYFMPPNLIKNKLENFAHQEFNTTEYKDTIEIEKKIKSGQGLLGRSEDNLVKVTKEHFPEDFFRIFGKYFY